MYFPVVCINFLNKFVGKMKEREVSVSDQDIVEVELMKACKDAKGKDSRFVSLLIPPFTRMCVLGVRCLCHHNTSSQEEAVKQEIPYCDLCAHQQFTLTVLLHWSG